VHLPQSTKSNIQEERGDDRKGTRAVFNVSAASNRFRVGGLTLDVHSWSSCTECPLRPRTAQLLSYQLTRSSEFGRIQPAGVVGEEPSDIKKLFEHAARDAVCLEEEQP
jgi:hypothetical protein